MATGHWPGVRDSSPLAAQVGQVTFSLLAGYAGPRLGGGEFSGRVASVFWPFTCCLLAGHTVLHLGEEGSRRHGPLLAGGVCPHPPLHSLGRGVIKAQDKSTPKVDVISKRSEI